MENDAVVSNWGGVLVGGESGEVVKRVLRTDGVIIKYILLLILVLVKKKNSVKKKKTPAK